MNGKARIIRTGWMTAVLLAVFVGLAGVQTRSSGQWPGEQWIQDQPIAPTRHAKELNSTLEKAGELIGVRVVDSRNKWLGTIQEIVLTPDRGAIDYAVLSYGGFWGVPEKRFAVPWPQFRVKPAEKALALDVDGKDVGKAKGLERQHWPTTANENWLVIERDRGGAIVARSPRSLEPQVAKDQPITDLRYRRVSRLIGMPVANPRGEGLGQIQDFVIDMQRGRPAYAVVAIKGDSPSQSAGLVAVPWSAFAISPLSATARLNTDRQTLEAYAFDPSSFPNLQDERYSRALHDRFHAAPYSETLGYVPAEDEQEMP